VAFLAPEKGCLLKNSDILKYVEKVSFFAIHGPVGPVLKIINAERLCFIMRLNMVYFEISILNDFCIILSKIAGPTPN
jgi:hypothetical protein